MRHCRQLLALFILALYSCISFVCALDDTAKCSAGSSVNRGGQCQSAPTKDGHYSDTGSTPSSSNENTHTTSHPTSDSSTSDAGAMDILFDTSSSLELFFEDHFEKTPKYISNSARSRSTRLRWMEHYRRFLPSGDLDKILSHNISFFNSTNPLQLHDDVDVFRIASVNDNPKQYLWMPISIPVQLDALRAAVRDGSVLHLHEMSYRSRSVAAFVDSLRTFWTVPTSASLSFHPPGMIHQPLPAPSISASELFVICIEGTASAFTTDEYFEFPLPHHTRSHSIHTASASVANDGQGNEQRNWTMHEGDVLYIPRGSSYDIRTTPATLAIFLYVYVHTEHRLIFHAIEHAIHMAVTRFEATILNSKLDHSSSASSTQNNATWADLLATSVRMAAEFTPAMRRFLPLSGQVRDLMDEAGLDVGETLLKDALGRFSRAASSALFDPLIDILTTGNGDESISAITSQEIISWAQALNKRSKHNNDMLSAAKETYHASVDDISKTSAATPEDIVNSMSLDWTEDEHSNWGQLTKAREQLLLLHGQLS